jgi:hypothetical protein
MSSWIRKVRLALLSLGAVALFAGSLNAQGVTSAAIVGTITQTGGAPVEGAIITVLNTSTGGRWQAVTRSSGRYFLENVATGGPFTIEARGIGFQPSRRTGIMLNLGQRYEASFELSTSPVELEELAVSAAVNPLINSARTGPATTISDSAIARLPLLGRDFTSLIQTAPQVVGTSVGGQNNRLNELQVDGGVNNDLFGLGSTGAPGGQVQSRAVSVEAVKEFQVLIAPFDLRQGNFTGGLINAITKSGDNDYHFSMFGYRQSSRDLGIRLVGDTQVGDTVSDFSVTQFGGTFSGPIVRDKAHFFISADVQDRSTPFDGVTLAEAGGLASDVTRMEAKLQSQGLEAGTAGPYVSGQPNDLFLGKVDWQVANNSRLALTYNYVTAGEGTILRATNGDYGLSGHSYNQKFNNHSIRANLNSVINDRFSNELIVGYQRLRDVREPFTTFPTVRVESGTAVLVTGAERFSHANALDQDVWELTDNFTFDLGQAHRVTIGTHNEHIKFRNVFFPQSLGQWEFDSIDDFEAGIPSKYDRALELIPNGPEASWKVIQLGVYAQDRWAVTPNLTLTGGIRMDVPIFPDDPNANPALAASAIGVNTADFPSGNILWSPRIGFNFDVKGDNTTVVRGGAGLFAGRPAYVWLSNAFSNSGVEQANLDCFGPDPALTAAYNDDPTTVLDVCPGGGGVSAPVPQVNAFDPNFKFQQNWKLALGLDQQLPWGMVGTLDLLYTMARNTLYYTDENLVGPQGTLSGEAGRVLYGDVTGGFGAEALKDGTVASNVLFGQNPGALNTDMSEDRAYQITAQLQKNFANGLSFNAGYTYSDAENLFDLTSSTASSQYGFNTLDGTLDKRNRTTSVFERRHKLTLSGSADIPLPESWPVQADFSLIYVGVSGSPYSYVVDGDINADGIGDGRQLNDEFYVPMDASDITLAAGENYQDLEDLILQEPCLREQRGQLNKRNSCRNPWANFLNTRLAIHLPTYQGARLELAWDIFNILNFIDGDWGLIKQTGAFSGEEIVGLEGYDAVNSRGIYSLSLPNFERVQDNASRWRMQFGAKLTY